MKEQKILLIEQMIKLISCALNGIKPKKEEFLSLDFRSLYRLANAHSVVTIVCVALESADLLKEATSDVASQFKEAKNKAIRKNMLFDSERENISEAMEKAGIWHMLLKGAVLKEFYPKYGMRQMSDNDILYDVQRQKDVMEIFLSRGYEAKSVGKGVHDIYMKPPVYNFEMHSTLFNEMLNEDWAKYYTAVKERLHLDLGKKYTYHFTEEDFYIYIIAHAYKHFSSSGTGLRTLTDIYVYNQKRNNFLNREYIHGELKKLKIADYEERNHHLAQKVFGDPDVFSFQRLTKEEQNLLWCYCGAGTYGNMKIHVENSLKSLQKEGETIRFFTKVKYVLIRLFPGRKWCKDSYPFIYKNPVFLPLFWTYRFFRCLIFRSKVIKDELCMVLSIKGEK